MAGVEEIDAQISDVNPTTYKWNRVRILIKTILIKYLLVTQS